VQRKTRPGEPTPPAATGPASATRRQQSRAAAPLLPSGLRHGPVTAAGARALRLWRGRRNYRQAGVSCDSAAVASLGVCSARPCAVPLPRPALCPARGDPSAAPRRWGLRSRWPQHPGMGSLLGAASGSGSRQPGKFSPVPAVVTPGTGRTIDVCLSSAGATQGLGTGRAGGTGSAPLLVWALGRRHRRGFRGVLRSGGLVGAVQGRCLGTPLPRGCHRALKQFVSGTA